MDFSLESDHEAIVEAVDRLCAQFDDNYWAACDAEHRFPWDFYDRMADGGWVGIAIPEKYGGGGRGIIEAALVMNRIAASGAAMNGSTAVHLTMFGLNPVVKFGNDQLKEAFLPRAALGDLHVAFGVTEPDAGTDTSRITTRARTDDGVTNRFGGLSLFLADLDPDHVDIRPIPKVGRNAVASCETAYDDLPVEGWRLVGERGRGFHHLLHGLNPERVLLAAVACGIGEAALRRAVGHAKERVVFDRLIGTNQAIAHPLAKANMELKAAWLMTLEAAWRYDNDLDCGEHANTAKYLAAEAGFFAADQAIQTHGGLGYASEYHVERYWREARLIRLAPVSQEMTCNYVAHNVLGLPRSY